MDYQPIPMPPDWKWDRDTPDVPMRTYHMTVNQVVGYNLRRARQERAITQEEAAYWLAPHLGARWSKQTFSAAEMGVRRDFSVNELVAMAETFDVPVAYFLQPPPWQPEIYTRAPDGGEFHAEARADLVKRIGEKQPGAAWLRALADQMEQQS